MRMKALVVGASGFVGPYLVREIRKKLHCDVISTAAEPDHPDRGPGGEPILTLDMRDGEAVRALILRERPYYLFHLAAQSSVERSWREPELTVDVNVKGAIHILEAIRGLAAPPKTLMVGSGEEYGTIDPAHSRIDEAAPVNPVNIYAVTKATQNMMAAVYADAYHLPIVAARSFNHFGPGQSPNFVASDFCHQAVRIEKGLQEPVIRVGNLSARRDFTDVRDVVAAYIALIQFGRAGETYNVGSGHAIAVEEILWEVCRQSSAEIRVETDPERLRPSDVPVVEADIAKIGADTGWQPHIPMKQTVGEMLEYWRKELGREA